MNLDNPLRAAEIAFTHSMEEVSNDADSLMGLRDEFIQRTIELGKVETSFSQTNPLVEATNSIQVALGSAIEEWATSWDAREETRKLAKEFKDKAILLVFGKVNAGKSSFCNYIAELFDGDNVRYFRLRDGKLCYDINSFDEGVTETTAQIQGIELGSKLILLDSPGLHSVTDENGLLTKNFTDSADAVLWLTPSTSPGQVQELDDLQMELESNKPLLPVITRSDKLVEDTDEDDNIIQVLTNKSSSNRDAQQTDVFNRTIEKLGSSKKLRQPLSVSVKVFKDSKRSKSDHAESGLAVLEKEMAELVVAAADYKPQKAKQIVANYLQNTVLATLESRVKPAVAELSNLCEKEEEKAARCQASSLTRLRHELAEKITDWAEEQKYSKNKKQLIEKINNLITLRLQEDLKNSVKEFSTQASAVIVSIAECDIGQFEDVSIQYEQVVGGKRQAATSATLTAVGSAVGLAFGGLVGAAIGGALGGILGGAAGSYFVETETISRKVGVDASEVVKSTLQVLDEKLPVVVDQVFAAWVEAIGQLKKTASEYQWQIEVFEQKLQEEQEEISYEC